MAKSSAEVVAKFGVYSLYSDGQLRLGGRGYDVKGCRAEFKWGYHEYGPSMGRMLVWGAAGSGPVDKTKCYVTVFWPNGSQLKLEGAGRDHEWGEHMAWAINDMNGFNPPAAAQWAADPSGRHQLRYFNGSAWTEHVTDNGAPGVDPMPAS